MNLELGMTSGTVRKPSGAVRRRARVAAGAVALGGVVLLLAAPSASARSGRGEPDADVAQCAVVSASVHGGTATFTVGPAGCTGETGQLSFSTYALPSGYVLPYADQVLFAHAPENGATYPAGSYVLTAALPACSWQADLYLGPSQDSAPHVHPIIGFRQTWDYLGEQPCPGPSPTVSTPAVPSPEPSPTVTTPDAPAPAVPTPETAIAEPSATASPTQAPPAGSTTETTPSAPAESVVQSAPIASPSPSTTSEVLAATPSPSPSITYVSEVLSASAGSSKGVLAATGSSAGLLLGGAAVLVATGVTLTLLRRRAVGSQR